MGVVRPSSELAFLADANIRPVARVTVTPALTTLPIALRVLSDTGRSIDRMVPSISSASSLYIPASHRAVTGAHVTIQGEQYTP